MKNFQPSTHSFFYQQENNWSHSENCTTRKSNTYTTRQWHIHPLLDKQKALRAENCVQTIYTPKCYANSNNKIHIRNEM